MIPRFTTTEPHSMFDYGKKTLEPVNNDSKERYWNKDYSYRVYIHGEAECDMGFDLPILVDGRMPDKEGTYACIVNGKEGHLYLWNSKYDATRLSSGKVCKVLIGFIVYVTDIKSRTYAEKCMDERRECI